MQWEPEITLEFWDRCVNWAKLVTPDESDTLGIPEYYYIKKDESNPLWKEYISWLNAKYKVGNWGWVWGGYEYFWYDGNSNYGWTYAYDTREQFKNWAKEITLEFWSMYMNIEKVTTTDHTDPETGKKYPNPYGISVTDLMDLQAKLKAADPYDVLSQSHVAHNTLTNNYIDYARYRTAALADMDIRVNTWVPAPKYAVLDEAMSGTYVQPEVPVKKSRYSSMLDLI